MNGTGKIALVTGANRGIGLEIARQLLATGCQVIGTARDPDALLPMAEAIGPEGAHPLQLDVTSGESVETAAREVSQRFGRLDILVNNAGIAPDQFVPGLDVSMELVQQTMETNFYGVLRCCQAFIPLMKAAGHGRVVNVSSELASMGEMQMGTTVAYRTSKAALNALTKLLSLELADFPDIKVNAACPGWVRTELGGPDATYSVEEGADTPVWLALLPDDGPTGGLFRQREPYPW